MNLQQLKLPHCIEGFQGYHSERLEQVENERELGMISLFEPKRKDNSIWLLFYTDNLLNYELSYVTEENSYFVIKKKATVYNTYFPIREETLFEEKMPVKHLKLVLHQFLNWVKEDAANSNDPEKRYFLRQQFNWPSSF